MGNYYDFDKARELQEFIYEHNLESELVDFYSYNDIKEMIINEIQDDNMNVAAHIMEAVSDLHDVADFFSYDRSMGTLEEVTSIYDIDDLFDIYGEQLEDMGIDNPNEELELDDEER